MAKSEQFVDHGERDVPARLKGDHCRLSPRRKAQSKGSQRLWSKVWRQEVAEETVQKMGRIRTLWIPAPTRNVSMPLHCCGDGRLVSAFKKASWHAKKNKGLLTVWRSNSTSAYTFQRKCADLSGGLHKVFYFNFICGTKTLKTTWTRAHPWENGWRKWGGVTCKLETA